MTIKQTDGQGALQTMPKNILAFDAQTPLHPAPLSYPAVVLTVTLLACPLISVHAAQQMTDAELQRHYLPVDTNVKIEGDSSAVDVFLKTQNALALNKDIDLVNIHSLLNWNTLQLSAGNTGTQASSQKLFDSLVVSNLGSERYSFRWAGNLQDIAQVGRVSYVFLGRDGLVDIEFVDVERNIGVEVTGYSNGRRTRNF